MVKNYMEVLMDELLIDIVREQGASAFGCTCENCMECIKAIALNNLQPLYINCKEGEDLDKYQGMLPQSPAEIMSELSKAIEIVRNKPRH